MTSLLNLHLLQLNRLSKILVLTSKKQTLKEPA